MAQRRVLLRPPVEVMRPTAAARVPQQNAMPGGALYQVKLDGFRCLAFCLPEGVVLQARSGRDLAARFPELVPALAAALPVGAVLDGEICAFAAGRFAFEQLLRTPAARVRDGVALSYVAFDALALPDDRGGARDLRERPLSERWAAVTALLADARAPVELVLSTRDRAEAMEWFERLLPLGVEGLVIKPLASRYGGPGWVKVRHTESVDAEALALIGSPARPRSLLVRLPDGRTLPTTPQLNALQAAQVAEAASTLLAAGTPDPEHRTLHRLAEPLAVEVRLGVGRHATARFVRVRGE